LNDSAWLNVPVADSFINAYPDFGKVSPQKTVVKIIYDDQAIYIAAYMYDTDPSKIATQLSARDQVTNSYCDFFAIGFDTYHDRQNAVRFFVGASGVQMDTKISPTTNVSNPVLEDATWDAVWQSAVKMQKDGWSVEMRIPYSALRFPSSADQTWGMQLLRVIPRYNNLRSTWSPADPNIQQFVSTWGDLKGLKNIKPPLRLAFSPFVVPTFQSFPLNATYPTAYQNNFSFTGGMDLKWGINESFTLDAQLIPDFTQVQSDNVILNITPFQVQYSENRPFFTEGTELFSLGGIFYSRRIGGTPIGYDSVYNHLGTNEEVVGDPSITPLYSAIKISGRTNSGLGIGLLDAVSQATYAVVKNDSTGQTRMVLTQPVSNYNVFVLRQSLKNHSYIGLINANVLYFDDTRQSNTTAVEGSFFTKNGVYDLLGNFKFSQIYEPQKTPQTGFDYNLDFSKVSGKIQFNFVSNTLSYQYDPNDLGIIQHNNFINNGGGIIYNQTVPQGPFLNYNANVFFNHDLRYFPTTYQDASIFLNGYGLFKNNYQINPNLEYDLAWKDYYEPRIAGLVFNRPADFTLNLYASTDLNKPVAVEFIPFIGLFTAWNEVHPQVEIIPHFRLNDHFNFSYDFYYSVDMNNRGYGTTLSDNSDIFGSRNVSTAINTLTVNYVFNAKMNISLKLRHYWSQLIYKNYYHLENDGSLLQTDTFSQNLDENYNIFTTDFLYTWEFLPGSFLNVIWKNNIQQSDTAIDDDYYENLKKTANSPISNLLAVKITLYLDYENVKHFFSKNHG
jgi:hypothetical protein